MITLELIRNLSEKLSVEVEKSRPQKPLALLITGKEFERYHATDGKKLWDGSGYKLISTKEAIRRSLMTYLFIDKVETLKIEWLTEIPKHYSELTRFGKLDPQKDKLNMEPKYKQILLEALNCLEKQLAIIQPNELEEKLKLIEEAKQIIFYNIPI